MRRAVETAATIAEALGLPISLDPRLRERMNWEGPEPIENFLAEWRRATVDRDFVPATGDSSASAAERFLEALDELASRHPGETVVVVAHGGATVDLLRTLMGDDQLSAMAPTLMDEGVPCGALTTLTHEANGWSVVTIASTVHLLHLPAGE